MSQPSSRVLARDPCRICRYPSWTEVPGDEDEKYELVCSNFDDLRLSSAASCLGCAVLVQAWEYGTPAADERTKEYITFNRCSGNLYVHLFKGSRRVLNIDVFTVSHMPLQAFTTCSSDALQHQLSRKSANNSAMAWSMRATAWDLQRTH